jgi:hypothetical protein
MHRGLTIETDGVASDGRGIQTFMPRRPWSRSTW